MYEFVAEQINRVITRHLDKFTERSRTKTTELAEKIDVFGSTNVEFLSRFLNKNNTKSLDKSYRHDDCLDYPRLVIEIV